LDGLLSEQRCVVEWRVANKKKTGQKSKYQVFDAMLIRVGGKSFFPESID
jgi:hypothetical protein